MKVVSAFIEVTEQHEDRQISPSLSIKKGDLNFDLKAKVIFNGCRKEQVLFWSLFSQQIYCKPLNSYNGEATIHPDDWKKWIVTLPVKSSPFSFWKCEITPEIVLKAREYFISMANAPAVKPDPNSKYKPTYDKITF